MRNQLDKAIRRVMAARRAEHRRAAVLVILALLTILSVSWRLHQVGTAMTDDEYSCGYEEHVHSDACYTEVLTCGYEDGASETPADSAEEDGEAAPTAHSHTADCYQRVLTCTLPEHTHTLECLADITADVETPADWDEQSKGVSSFWSDAMTEIAQRQLGYTESAKNFTVDEALGETLEQAHHYTRYGDWYGNPYGSWDVMFVAFCQHYAGIPEDVIPQCASLLQLRTELENAHPEYITPGGSEATPGDIVLYTNAAGEETIGIVTAYDGANLTVVSGAVDGAVAAVTVAEADVADTISVLDAYGVYAQTGASDGLEEFPLDAEDDDTLTAAAATPEHDSEGNLKLDNLLTSTDISIKQGDVWEPLVDDAPIKDGTPVRVEITYKVPAGAFPNDKNTATYTLPAGVYPKKDRTGDITDSNDEIIGTFTLTKNSPTVTFTFNNNTNHEFHGTFKFETTIDYSETGGDGKIHLGEKVYTIQPEYSLKTKKEHTLSEDKSKVSYTVTVNAPNGTHNQTVTITDPLAAENTANGSYDTSSIKIDGKPLSEYKDAEIIYNADGKGFTITGLPPLGYNQSYKLTYDVNVGAVTGADGSGTIVNTAKGTTSTLQSNEAKDTVTVQESSIAKAGTYNAATHRINWAIKVKNPGGDLAGYKVTDTQVTQLDIVGDVTLKRADGTVVTTIPGSVFMTNGYTFPAGSNASSYTFTYQTVAPDPVNGTVSATNQATLENGSRSYTATANVSTGVGKVDIRKYPGTVTPLENGDQKVMWNITGTVPAGVNSFKIVDNIREPLYGVKTQLETAIRNNLSLTMEGGTTLTWEEAEKNGIQIQLSLFSNGSNDWHDPDNGSSVPDDATAVHRIRLQFSRPDGEKLRILRCTISDIPTVAKTSDMANNTTRHFVNRAEIYSNNAGSEGWRGTYDYTKIGSITKETSDKSDDGYKQNNSTTYTKNKVIWYRIKLNLGSGDVDKTHTLTVVDKIPDGMKLATDNNSLSSYRIAADLDADSSKKYTGSIKKLGENQYGLKPFWTIDTSVPGQLTIQVLPDTLKKLIVQNKTTDHYVEIRYALQLDDAAAWNERTLEEKTYTNAATWDGASTSSGMTITRPKKELLEKTGNYDAKTHQANYTLCINPRAEDLAPGSDTLELTDTMESTYFGKTGMELMLDSIKVYEYILQDGDWVKGNEVKDGVRVEKVEETASTRKYKFILPDEKALVLEYSYKMNPGNLASNMKVTNTAALAGGKPVGSNVPVKNDSASATVHNTVLTVAKTDSATNLAITASPATFAIYHYNKTDSKWESIGTRQTTNGSFDLIFAQSPAEGSSHLATGNLYKLVETAAPEDYAPDETPRYFIWNNNATDDDKKADALAAATGTTVLEGVTTANVSFLGVNGDRATMAIPNKQNCLTLRKIWYGIGNDTIEAPVDEIQVQLYRYQDGKDKADAVAVGTPVSLTKADGWTKKISSLKSGYHYYVEELGTDSGALVFYEVKYSESNATGVTGGGTITITNKQKPSYELPATGAAGTPPYTAAGALIMGIALMLRYLINKRSHSRGGEN